ncbi:MAG: type II secretion system minor pseudopilin GspI [Thiomargarita sp.]|nr:type II secretion system minor pseudopilin GspI [Thiomargarita sp.]
MKHFKLGGFTLLEILVALAVLAIGLGAAIKVSTENIENTNYLRDKMLAHWVGMNVLTEIQVRNEWLSIGKQQGTMSMANREWFWILRVSETADNELRRLNVAVYYSDSNADKTNSIAILTGFVAKSE